jgi:hypothetical protein
MNTEFVEAAFQSAELGPEKMIAIAHQHHKGDKRLPVPGVARRNLPTDSPQRGSISGAGFEPR